jgi:4-aminobutyrate aminotransferase
LLTIYPSIGKGKVVAELSQILKQATGVLAARGEGVQLYDEQGRRYLDFTAGIGVTSTGHCHPRVVEAAQRQVATLIHAQYTTVMHRPLLTLVERLGEVLPEGLDRMFFANSGRRPVGRMSLSSMAVSTAGRSVRPR